MGALSIALRGRQSLRERRFHRMNGLRRYGITVFDHLQIHESRTHIDVPRQGLPGLVGDQRIPDDRNGMTLDEPRQMIDAFLFRHGLRGRRCDARQDNLRAVAEREAIDARDGLDSAGESVLGVEEGRDRKEGQEGQEYSMVHGRDGFDGCGA